ncbi:hypothetical protein K438DRAFT_1864839 [Mycena galopus ATCC 62051]|nr:hypothetical protein K438DRAFT_1864839 [Mycena galopus ATCC 62051]
MASPLPDEIISEIFSLSSIKISDKDFSDNSAISPFASYSRSTSAFLLVCKAWLRVSTPLLYNVVVIRSKAQAQALEAALKGNKDLGAFIKKLRVEGGYGQTMKTILKASPNITDLVLSLAIWSSDGVSGLCQGLDLIDPIRLIVHDVPKPGNNKHNLQLVDKVAECIKRWKRLRTVHVPLDSFNWAGMGLGRSAKICDALKTAPSIEEVFISFTMAMMTPRFITDLRKNPSIKRVKIKDSVSHSQSVSLRKFFDPDGSLQDFVEFTIGPNRSAEITLSSNPLFVPMESVPQEISDKIWERILYFAMYMDEFEDDLTAKVHTPLAIESESELCPHDDSAILIGTDAMLVSKQFKRLSVPLFYRYVHLDRPGDLSLFSTTLMRDPTIATHIRSLCVSYEAALPAFPESDSDLSDYDDWSEQPSQADELLPPIVQLLPGLISFTGAFYFPHSYPPRPHINGERESLIISWPLFQKLAATAGASLQRLCVEVAPPAEVQSPIIFEPFVALRSLEWKCGVEFSSDAEPTLAPETLAHLECLSLVDYHTSFLDVLAMAELPSLRRVYFYGSVGQASDRFFERHGSKLTEAMLMAGHPQDVNVLNACPTLPRLICADNTESLPSVDLVSPSKPHLHLTSLVLDVSVYSRKEEKAMGEFFNALDPALLPALREIQVTRFTGRRPKPLGQWAEKLLSVDIKLTDIYGKHWTPRLKGGGR